MGVTGLWKLIEPCGKPVPVETLEGKIIAVDISIWLHQVVKGFQDSKGSALANAHLLGLFHRLCKLLYYRVRPVFVFDGFVPQLKRDTIARRQQQRSKLNSEADRIQALLMQSLAKEKVVQQALGASQAELLLKSPLKRLGKASRSENAVDDLFKLPEIPVTSTALKKTGTENSNEESDLDESSFTSCTSDDYSSLTSTDDNCFDQSNTRHTYNSSLQTIDVRSQHFRNLPPDVRHEILVDIKETRKQSSWGRLHELPPRSDDFSSFQMKRLLKRRAVQESLEEAQQEMGGRSLTYNELNTFFTEEGIVEPTAIEQNSKQICSDENTRFLLVRDLKKKMANITQEEKKNSSKLSDLNEIKKSSKEIQSTGLTSVKECSPEKEDENSESLDDEYAADLELAIARSLEDSTSHVYTEKDFQYDPSEELKLNREQRKQLKNAAIGPARAYMIEYAGMNDTEVAEILENTQTESKNTEEPHFLKFVHKIVDGSQEAVNINNDEDHLQTKHSDYNSVSNIILHVSDESETDSDVNEVIEKVCSSNSSEILQKKEDNLQSNLCDDESTSNIILHVSEESETDSDLEEVTETVHSSNTTQKKDTLEIVLNVKEPLAPSDDIFADIFKPEKEIKTSHQKETIFEVINEKVEETKCNKNIPNNSTTTVGNFIKPATDSDISKIAVLDEKKENMIVANVTECSLGKRDVKASDILSILDEVKKQAIDVKKITLEDINFIEISDEDTSTITKVTPKKNNLKSEVIEIYDSDDGTKIQKLSVTPTSNKSPQSTTPTKTKGISEYFEINYVIKRTPEKTVAEEEEQVPKVKSPFFVKKTPPSKRKHTSVNNVEHSEKTTKAAKALFSSYVTNGEEKVEAETNTEDEPRKEKPTPFSETDVINEAAQALKDQKTDEELHTLATDLAKERQDLEGERNRQDRMGTSISKRMNTDCQELLRLFGIPYIVAPTEAEAQCAFLDATGLTNGTITDDSDIWLFGGRTVYKNFFAQNKHVLEFRAERIENSFNCDRKKLIQLACLVGSDYTTGVHGVGAVTALEILASFSQPKESKSNDDNTQSAISAALITLSNFRDWWKIHKTTSKPPGSSARLALLKKLKNIDLHEGFPNIAVLEAYMTPKVDECKDTFSWGNPDIESIREFTKKSFGWTRAKTDETLTPVLKRINEKKTQLSIHKYFSTKSSERVRELKVSKRVQKAIEKMSGNIEEETPGKPKTTRAASKRKQPAATKPKGDIKRPNKQRKNVDKNNSLSLEASTSSGAGIKKIKNITQH